MIGPGSSAPARWHWDQKIGAQRLLNISFDPRFGANRHQKKSRPGHPPVWIDTYSVTQAFKLARVDSIIRK